MKKRKILAVDVGTSALKMGIFNQILKCIAHGQAGYALETPDSKKVQIDSEKWWKAFVITAKKMSHHFHGVEAISISAASPGLTAMDKTGKALYPSIPHLDGRSAKQCWRIHRIVGQERLLKITCNLPFPGGCSGASILWIRDHFPEIYRKTAKFGHTNSFFVKRLTGKWGIDPSNASLSSFYNTHSLRGWNKELIRSLDIAADKLPPIVRSHEIVGRLTDTVAEATGLKSGMPVLMGGNDAACASLSAGVTEHGQILNITGTSEILNICLRKPLATTGHNIRAHVIPNKWLILFILNTGGKSIEWFFNQFCADMTTRRFYKEYLPQVMEMERKSNVKFIPFLSGDRYSLKEKYASFSGLGLDTTREDLLFALISGIVSYMRSYVSGLQKEIILNDVMYFTGGGAKAAFMKFKKKAFPEFRFEINNAGSLRGAAMLARDYLS